MLNVFMLNVIMLSVVMLNVVMLSVKFNILLCTLISKRKNRLLKFCYVPATSAAHNRLLFFLFLLRPFTVLMKKTRAVKQSIFLDVYGYA